MMESNANEAQKLSLINKDAATSSIHKASSANDMMVGYRGQANQNLGGPQDYYGEEEMKEPVSHSIYFYAERVSL